MRWKVPWRNFFQGKLWRGPDELVGQTAAVRSEYVRATKNREKTVWKRNGAGQAVGAVESARERDDTDDGHAVRSPMRPFGVHDAGNSKRLVMG